jgi:hypothetical protein
VAAGLFGSVAGSHASDAIQGETARFEAPSGVVERCVRIARIPGGRYLDADEQQESALCSIDVHVADTALCPKLFSTSPGTLIYDLAGGPWAGRAGAFEEARCRESAPLKDGTNGPPASLKTTMNAPDTSGTFSVAPLIYYHFARYLNSALHVPPVVYRSIDRQAFAGRVVGPGEAGSANRSALKMNHAGWVRLSAAMRDPATYQPTDELFTGDRRQVYGAMLHYSGKRYGPEFNGTRASGWGDGQSRDFQDTAPFRALRSDKPLPEAVAEGLAAARRDPVLAKAMGGDITDEQVVYWMQELTEITVLDFIFSQQDRIGNIDYRSFWHWEQDGEVRRALASGSEPPPEARGAKLIRRTELNDNDAAGRVAYANYAKRTRMLEGIRHYHADTYRRVQWLAADFEAQGEVYAYARDSFGLSRRQLGQLVANAIQAAAIIRATCEAGEMRFDLDADAFFLTGRAEEEAVECSGW